MARIKLGELLVQAGAIDQMQLQGALAEQKKWGRPLGRTLVELRMIDEKTLVAALSRQLNIPAVDLEVLQIPTDVLKYLKKDFCFENSCIPFRHVSKGNFLDVAMSDPTNFELFDRIRVATRCNVRPYLAGPFALEASIRKHYLGQAVSVTRDNRPWAQSNPDEALFDMSGGVATRSGEMRVTVPTEELDLDVVPPRAAGHQPLVMPRSAGAAQQQHPPTVELGKLTAEVERLSTEVSDLTALLERDEKVIRKLMAIMVEKGVCTKQELLARINKE
jgi:type IV pilus assembly protein PilB